MSGRHQTRTNKASLELRTCRLLISSLMLPLRCRAAQGPPGRMGEVFRMQSKQPEAASTAWRRYRNSGQPIRSRHVLGPALRQAARLGIPTEVVRRCREALEVESTLKVRLADYSIDAEDGAEAYAPLE